MTNRMQWSKPTLGDLRRERRGASFDVWQMTQLIYGDKLEKIEYMTKLVMSDPALQADDIWWMDRMDR